MLLAMLAWKCDGETLHYIALQAFGRRSYPERRTTKRITITRNKCVENPRGEVQFQVQGSDRVV
uniref:Uncharacterized protein n=1 Tax=Anguilla anguilla TaxID=7936 RepID=A0A0E9X0N3_ANGAN